MVVAPVSSTASAATSTRYLVRRGDTLSDVAVNFGVSQGTVARANGLANQDLIYAGSYLTIPSGSAKDGGSASRTYKVQVGDTISSVAARFGVSQSALAKANGLSNPNLVISGRTLVIPGASGSTGSSTSKSAVKSPTTEAGKSSSRGLPAALRDNAAKYQQYAPAFQRWASAYGVPLDLLKGLCWLESGWQPSVVSSTGAIGMCQFMPNTTQFVSALVGAPMNPWSPSDNIRLSARYLRYLLDRSGGDVRIAVASYYQGFDSVTSRGMYTDTVAYVEGVLAFRQRF